ncbi:MAG: gliding motility-associated C-terminal domain-containing protein [Chitinophagales bacterium]
MRVIYALLCFFLCSNSFAQNCFYVDRILVDACGSPEAKNEMLRFHVGSTPLNVNNLTITWFSNPFLGICQNANTAAKTAALNRSIQKCGWLLEPVGGVLPANKEVLLVTSENMDTLANSFADLQDTMIIIYQCGNASSGHFKNYQAGAGPRSTTLTFSGAGGCSQTATYVVDSLVNPTGGHSAADGAAVSFTSNGVPSYYNSGCAAPVTAMSIQILNNDTTTCPGKNILLKSKGTGYRYISWIGGKGLFSNPDSTQTYYTPSPFDSYPILLQVKAFTNCPFDTIRDTLIVQRFPNTTSGGSDTSVCSGFSVGLFASGGVSYQWMSSASLSCLTCPDPIAAPLSDTNYLVTITDVHQCLYQDTVFVKVNPIPNLSVSHDTTVCNGSTLVLNAQSSTGVLWLGAGLSCNNCYSTTLLVTGFTSVYVTTVGRCAIHDTVDIEGLNVLNPSVSIQASTASICSGEAITFLADTVSVGVGVTIEWLKNNIIVPGQNQLSYTDSNWNNADSIQCRVTTTASCAFPTMAISNRIIIQVSPKVIPSILIHADYDTICSGNSVTCSAAIQNGGTAPVLNWYRNGITVGSGSTYSFNGFQDGDSVWCILTSNAACANLVNSKSNVLVIHVNPIQHTTVSVVANPVQVCQGQLVNFHASAFNAGVTPHFIWKKNGTTVGYDSSGYSDAGLLPGDSIWVEMISSVNCVSPSTAISSKSSALVQPLVTPAISIDADDTICAGATATFSAVISNGGPNPMIIWTRNHNPEGSNSYTFSTSAINSGDQIQAILISNEICVVSDTVNSNIKQMTVLPELTPSVVIEGDTEICFGDKLHLKAIATNGGSNPIFTWQKNHVIVGNQYVIDIADVYSGDSINVVLLSNAFCRSASSVTSAVLLPVVHAIPKVEAFSDTSVFIGESVVLRATGALQYQWTPSESLNSAFGNMVVASPSVSTVYFCEGVDEFGCRGTDTVRVTVLHKPNEDTALFVPTAFTPNRDGHNDGFKVVNSWMFREVKCHIYNRWGELVFVSDDADESWDGIYKGNEQPSGVYVVTIDAISNNLKQVHYSGTVTLLR